MIKTLFFGLPAGISAIVLAGLLDDDYEIAGVVVPADRAPHLLPNEDAPYVLLPPRIAIDLPLLGGLPVDVLSIAAQAGLPVIAVRDFTHPETVAALASLEADVACVACFTRLIPPAILRLPRHGFLNLHPSLLPMYRGPEPVFWQLRDGAPMGVTVHYIDEGLDSGDIAEQAACSLPDGLAGAEIERRLMLEGLGLLQGILAELSHGVVRRRPQPPGGSYQGFPARDDFSLSPDWSARRAFNFMRATSDYRLPYRLDVDATTLWLDSAISYSLDSEIDRAVDIEGDDLLIRFNPGIVRARVSG